MFLFPANHNNFVSVESNAEGFLKSVLINVGLTQIGTSAVLKCSRAGPHLLFS